MSTPLHPPTLDGLYDFYVKLYLKRNMCLEVDTLPYHVSPMQGYVKTDSDSRSVSLCPSWVVFTEQAFGQLSPSTLQMYGIIPMQLWRKTLLCAMCVTRVCVIPRYQMLNGRNYGVLCAVGYTESWSEKGSFCITCVCWLNAALLFLFWIYMKQLWEMLTTVQRGAGLSFQPRPVINPDPPCFCLCDWRVPLGPARELYHRGLPLSHFLSNTNKTLSYFLCCTSVEAPEKEGERQHR